MKNELEKDELIRYTRQIKLPSIGLQGQQRLKNASLLIVGVGGLGSAAVIYLAAAGVGRIGLIDEDMVDLSNLQRQVLYSTSEIGLPKVECARGRLLSLNPEIEVTTICSRLTQENASDIIRKFDLVVDCCDNISTRYCINEECVRWGKPFVYGSIFQYEGQVSVFSLPEGPCYRCVFPESENKDISDLDKNGVIGSLPGTIGTIQATEAIKIITGIGKPLSGRMLHYDSLNMEFNIISLRKNPSCLSCRKP